MESQVTEWDFTVCEAPEKLTINEMKWKAQTETHMVDTQHTTGWRRETGELCEADD